MKYKILIDKPRSPDFVEVCVEASGAEAAYRFGETLARLMGVDVEWCPKQEKDIDKPWGCSSVAQVEPDHEKT